MTDAVYHPDYLSDKIGKAKRLQWAEEKFFVATEEEPLFDAADVLRFGKDLVVQHGFTTNLKGIEWICRHFPDHRVHAVNFPGDPYPIHIDATFTPLRPGLILNNPQRGCRTISAIFSSATVGRSWIRRNWPTTRRHRCVIPACG